MDVQKKPQTDRHLGRQIADVGTSVAGGLNPFLIIAQQAPQVADALTDTGGKAAKVASFDATRAKATFDLSKQLKKLNDDASGKTAADAAKAVTKMIVQRFKR